MTTNEIEAIVDEYTISHKGSMQCKCISGARGHLIAKLLASFEKEYKRGKADSDKEWHDRIVFGGAG